jgi:hypothetical protein
MRDAELQTGIALDAERRPARWQVATRHRDARGLCAFVEVR